MLDRSTHQTAQHRSPRPSLAQHSTIHPQFSNPRTSNQALQQTTPKHPTNLSTPFPSSQPPPLSLEDVNKHVPLQKIPPHTFPPTPFPDHAGPLAPRRRSEIQTIRQEDAISVSSPGQSARTVYTPASEYWTIRFDGTAFSFVVGCVYG